jgi:hypothetical protein
MLSFQLHVEGDNPRALNLYSAPPALQQPDDPDCTLKSIVAAAVQLIPGVDEASISAVLARERVRSQTLSEEIAWAVDALQDELGQGRAWTRPITRRPSGSPTWLRRPAGRASPSGRCRPGRPECCRSSCTLRATTPLNLYSPQAGAAADRLGQERRDPSADRSGQGHPHGTARNHR